MLDLYTIFIELRQLGLTNKIDHKRRMEAWRLFVREKMTNKISLSIIPLFFNYCNETMIASYIEENVSDFLQKSQKDSYFVVTCKILQYPNRVLSVRLIIAFCYKVPSDERNDEEIDKDLYQTQIEAYGEEETNEEDEKLLDKVTTNKDHVTKENVKI
jgi:hypothetical protein